jgi:hypothetical protein
VVCPSCLSFKITASQDLDLDFHKIANTLHEYYTSWPSDCVLV